MAYKYFIEYDIQKFSEDYSNREGSILCSLGGWASLDSTDIRAVFNLIADKENCEVAEVEIIGISRIYEH